jgi:hypothetical protein|tara:strand:- start:217 stop:648 length:432 start_codon:yes stop_codon:yes gene_type:complete
MPKIVILSHFRVGSTNFKKTLEQITGQEFWNEPKFKQHKSIIDSMGFEYFMSKSELKSMKCDYENSKDYLVDILNYADMVFLILRKDVDSQIKSYKKLVGIELDKEELIESNKKMLDLVEKHPNHRILYYEDIKDFLHKKVFA